MPDIDLSNFAPWFQWIVTTIVALIGIFAGRMWERHDRRIKKDKELIEKILELVSIGSEIHLFLQRHDFGDAYFRNSLQPLDELERLLSQPSNFFINRKLERKKRELYQDIVDFRKLISERIFVRDMSPDTFELPRPNRILEKRVSWIRNEGIQLSDAELDQLKDEIQKDFQDSREKLNLMSNSICEKYDDLVSTAHKIL